MVIATRPTEGEANVSPLELPEGGVDAPELRYFVMASEQMVNTPGD